MMSQQLSEEVMMEEGMGEEVAQDVELELQGSAPASEPVAPAPPPVVHTYDDLFPALPNSPLQPPVAINNNDSMRVGSSNVTQVFTVPFSERKQDHSDKFGEGESLRTCLYITKETRANIEISGSRDQSLTFVVTGKLFNVQEARRRILSSFQTQASKQINIPKEHHRWILGKQGQRLKELERTTATRISVPSIDAKSDIITVTGTKEGIEMAEHEIRVCSDEQSRKASERISVPKIYHPFIFGAYNENLTSMTAETGARINIPPPSVMKDEIVIAGEKEGVLAAKAKIEAIYKEMDKKCTIVSVEVPKSQHKYVFGFKGATIQEILKETGVSVEMPSSDSDSGTITLRGPHDKLGLALSKVCEKANSRCATNVHAPAWIYKYIIGKKGAKIKKFTQDFPKVHLEFPEGENKIKIEGPPEEVEKAQAELDAIAKSLLDTLTFVEFELDQKYSKYIVGKAGTNVNRLKDEHGVIINVGDTIRIEGSREGVAAVQKELNDMINKLENEKERDVIIDHKYFKSLIGTKGENIKEIKEKFNNQVQIIVPNHTEKRDIVKLRGPSEDVDKCHKYLLKVVKELTESSYVQEVPIFKQFHRFVVGKGGANIRKIRDETQTRIDLPPEGDQSDCITVTGKKENVEEAIKMIQKINNELANVVSEEVTIAPKFYNSLIGAGGKLVHSIMEDCGGVSIKFPLAESKSDKVIIRGPADEVERAKQQLLELASERQLSSFSCEVRVNPLHHKFLIGKNGANVKQLRAQTGARILFPNEQDSDRESITIIGRQEAVEEARKRLEATIRDIDNIVEGNTDVAVKYHRHFVARRGEVLNAISEECGNVQISFPKHGGTSTRVLLKGAKDCIAAAIQRITDIVADLEAQVTIECVIPQTFHRSVMGAKGCKVQSIAARHEVQIKFPDRDLGNRQPMVNGGSQLNGETETESAEPEPPTDTPKPADIIRITGRLENCEAAKQDLLDQVPVTVEMAVPHDIHRSLIGQRGRDAREFQNRYDVHISVPPHEQKLDTIKISGAPANVEEAKKAIEERCLKAFVVKLEVDSEYHPMVIGRGGAVISKIRATHDVQINLPKKGDPEENIITIQGLEEKALAARDAIMEIVNVQTNMVKEEVRIDSRVHSRLIGARGHNIRKIMDEHKVDIRFPRNSGDPDIVTIIGANAGLVDEARTTLENLQEEYMQDISDVDIRDIYRPPPAPTVDAGAAVAQAPAVKEESVGFVVPQGPWEQRAPDTASTQEFPSFGPPAPSADAPPASVWGPRR